MYGFFFAMVNLRDRLNFPCPEQMKQSKMDAAGLLYDAAAKKLEFNKIAVLSEQDSGSSDDILENQLIYIKKAGDMLLKLLHEMVL